LRGLRAWRPTPRAGRRDERSEASPRVTSTNKDNLMFAMRYGELYVSTNSKGFSNEAPCVGHLMALDLETGIQVQVTSVAG